MHTRQAVIELKYQPRGRPKWRKDLQKLEAILANRSKISIANVRYRGIDVDPHSYSLAEDTLFVWGGVNVDSDLAIMGEATPALRRCLLELHASTQDAAPPRIRCSDALGR